MKELLCPRLETFLDLRVFEGYAVYLSSNFTSKY